MPVINMRSAATIIKGQGVGSCYEEQVKLVKERLPKEFSVYENENVKSDIIHFHTVNFSYFLERIMKRKKITAIGYVHFLPETLDDSLKLPWLYRVVFYRYLLAFYNSMDYLVTVNPTVISKIRSYKINKPNVLYIPNFVSEKHFYPMDEEICKMVRKKYEIGYEKFVVLGAGQLQTRKGIFDFVKTAEKMPDVQFVWAGGFSFGKITDGYEEISKIVENPPANVRFLGIVDRSEMAGLYNMADIMFLPSFDELFPMTILEAIACKRPILLRDIEIYEEILGGYYLKGKNVDDFVNVLLSISANPKLSSEWKEKAWECNLKYNEDSILIMWEKLYTEAYEKLKAKSAAISKRKLMNAEKIEE